jgi:hypothetical protein
MRNCHDKGRPDFLELMMRALNPIEHPAVALETRYQIAAVCEPTAQFIAAADRQETAGNALL